MTTLNTLYTPKEIATGVRHFADVTEREIAAYQEQGFLVLQEAFTPEEMEEAEQGILHLLQGGNPEFTSLEFEEAAQETLPNLTPEERIHAVRKLMSFTPYEPRLQRIADTPPLLALITRLLEATPHRFQDMALLKPPHWGREKPWHQDHAYFDVPLGTKIVGVWIAVHEATLENGCMHLLPGGHREGPRLHYQRRDWQICDTEMVEVPSVAVPLKPGGCLLFDGLLPHGTPPNHSSQLRHALQFHYQATDASRFTREERLAIFGGEGQNVSC